MKKFGMPVTQQQLTDVRVVDNAHIISQPWFKFLSDLFTTTQSGVGILQSSYIQIGGAGLGALTAGTNWLIPAMARNATILSASAFTSAGTATVAIKIAGVSVTGLAALAATTTSIAPVLATALFNVTAGQAITAVVSSASVAAGQALIIQVNYTIP